MAHGRIKKARGFAASSISEASLPLLTVSGGPESTLNACCPKDPFHPHDFLTASEPCAS